MAANGDIIETEYEQYLDDDERVLWSNTNGSKSPHLRLELLLPFAVVFPLLGIGLLRFVDFRINENIIIVLTILGSWLLAAAVSLEWPKSYILTDKRILLFHRSTYKILDYGAVSSVYVTKKKKSGKADVVLNLRKTNKPEMQSQTMYDVEDAETVRDILKEKTDVVAKTRKKQEEIERWQQW
ncbi:MAG: hypothetical protein IKH96_02890 [Ruminococcus sp.]|uniref:hypothetical protein n=1 Tax=Ruminococcus sp. TaxID=41978 RepID=UPI0025EECE2E|nr:hypothetical protein [Ruminococcus sp.]MBR3666985.1 hypothetical protein [Ruminococcus sp.]MBR6994948.1 hypothetical protein [Ruminococcus sp.]